MKKILKKVVIWIWAVLFTTMTPITALAENGAAETGKTIVSTKEAIVTASYSMFKIDQAAKVNTYSDGSMTVEITYSGSSFLKMYLGAAEEAENATEGIYDAVASGEGYTYTLPLKELDKEFNAAVLSGRGNWKNNTLTVSLKEQVTLVSTKAATVTASYSMFKIDQAAKVNTYSDGSMTVEISYPGKSFLKMYLGTAEEAENATEGIYDAVASGEGYTYTLPLKELDKEFNAAVLSGRGTWKNNTLTVSLAEEPTPTPTPTPTPIPTPTPETSNIPADGTYKITVESSASMFKIVDCVLTVENQKMTAVITLSGTGYDYLYMGTAADAAINSGDWITYKVNSEGKYTYEIPVSKLDAGISVAAHSVKNDKWFDRNLTFLASTLQQVTAGTTVDNTTDNGNDRNDSHVTETTENTTLNTGVTSDAAIQEMIANTTKGEVEDGTYTPSFGYKGGTGKVTISCNKVVVKDGKATATIVFSSSAYTYAKVNGAKYYNLNKGGNSTFEIPVNLNGETAVAAETTAMGTPHEIEYTLYVYVNGKDVSGIKTLAAEKSEEETEDGENEAETEEEIKEENAWGAFNSQQRTKETKNEKEKETEKIADDKKKDFSHVGTVIAVVVGMGLFGGATVFVLNKKGIIKIKK